MYPSTLPYFQKMKCFLLSVDSLNNAVCPGKTGGCQFSGFLSRLALPYFEFMSYFKENYQLNNLDFQKLPLCGSAQHAHALRFNSQHRENKRTLSDG